MKEPSVAVLRSLRLTQTRATSRERKKMPFALVRMTPVELTENRSLLETRGAGTPTQKHDLVCYKEFTDWCL